MCAVRPMSKKPMLKRQEELSAEPTLLEALADPVIQAVMARDRVSRDEVVKVAMAARARLFGHRGVVVALPAVSLAPAVRPTFHATAAE